MQPSEYEIQREVEALRDIRRRSTANAGVTLDPDLPATPTSPTAAHQYWNLHKSSRNQSSASSDGDSSSDSHEGSTAEGNGNPMDDPFHLFWVPASLHPEIAPAEFRQFLKEHSHTSLSGDGSLTRSASTSAIGSGLGRKKSLLSRQYKPAENDGVENEKVVPLRRNKSSMYTNRGPQLTINDLQRLDELAEEAQASDDPSKLRTMLRRSLTMNISPSVIDTLDNMPEMEDEADVPIIVPPPGQILRRAARTKIRKPSLPGDGGGHRFGLSRRGGARSGTKSVDRISGDLSDAGESSEKLLPRKRIPSETTIPTRPESYSEETSIYEAYVRDDDDAFAIISPPIEEEEKQLEAPSAILEALAPVLHHPQPQDPDLPPLPTSETPLPSRTPSPVQSQESVQPQPPPTLPPQPQSPSLAPPTVQSPATPGPSTSVLHSPPSSSQRKDKEKKGLFAKWGGDKSGKKSGKEKGGDAEKEKEGSFFGSFFGSKKKHEDGHVPIGSGHAAGRETAAALLGASKSKSNPSPLSPVPPGGNPWARYPIHVERAIYRLSHIKLANPRRPLYEQVLISNLMFWYLGVINKTNNPTPATPTVENQQPAITENGEATSGSDPDAEEQQRLERERLERERLERERMERERQEKERQEKEAMEAKKKESRRGPLTRPAPAGAPRRAEMPVKGPQYEMQHRVMEQVYGKQEHYQRAALHTPQPQHPASKLIQNQPTNYVPDGFYYNNDQSTQQTLPPGAMAPVDREQPWPRSTPRQHTTSAPSPPPSGNGVSPHRRSRSPPLPQQSQQALYAAGEKPYQNGHRSPSRSMSAVASPTSPQTNGARIRKGSSAHAVSYTGRPRTSDGGVPKSSETGEEDVPLAVWQQQRRR